MRVTEVLTLAGLRDGLKHVKDPEWYMRRGSMIHKAVALMDLGKLDWAATEVQEAARPENERIVPFIRAAEKFRLDFGGVLVAAEQEVSDPIERVVGHFDAIYQGMRFKGHKKSSLVLVDWKANQVDKATAIQTAKYADMWQKANKRRRITYRCGVALHDDGTYRITWYTDYQGDLTLGWKGAYLKALWEIRNETATLNSQQEEEKE